MVLLARGRVCSCIITETFSVLYMFTIVHSVKYLVHAGRAELKIIFEGSWPYGQPVHDLVGHLIKLGGQKIKIESHCSGKTKNTELMKHVSKHQSSAVAYV